MLNSIFLNKQVGYCGGYFKDKQAIASIKYESDEFELQGHSFAVHLLNRLESDQFQSRLFSFAADPYYLEVSGLKYDIPDTLRQSVQGQYSGVRDPLSGHDTLQ